MPDCDDEKAMELIMSRHCCIVAMMEFDLQADDMRRFMLTIRREFWLFHIKLLFLS